MKRNWKMMAIFVLGTSTIIGTVDVSAANSINADKAKQISLAKAGGGFVVKVEKDYEKGVRVYEIDILNGTTKYDITVQESNGAILKFETEYRQTAETPVAGNPTSISAEAAKQIALTKAGGGTVTRFETDIENGIQVYEIEILNGMTEYDVTVQISNGAILKFETENRQVVEPPAPTTNPEPSTPTPSTNPEPSTPTPSITTVSAKQIALTKTGGGTITKFETDTENGIKVYVVEILNGSTEYDVTVQTSNGAILKFESEKKQTAVSPATTTTNPAQITTESAKQIALSKTGGGTVTKFETDTENGVKVYEVEILNGSTEYDVTVQASNGAILKFESEKKQSSTATAGNGKKNSETAKKSNTSEQKQNSSPPVADSKTNKKQASNDRDDDDDRNDDDDRDDDRDND